jgi:hypothetical protein
MGLNKRMNSNNPNGKSPISPSKKEPGSKPKDLSSQLKIVFLDNLKREEESAKNQEVDVDMTDFEIPEEHIKIVDEFLTKFTIVSESSMNDHLDILLMLKALPNKIIDYTFDQTE